MALKGFIFDFDGLILDTEVPGCNAWVELFDQHGFTFTVEDWKKAIGTGPSAYDPGLHLHQLTGGRVDAETLNQASFVRSLELVKGQPILPGVEDFIQASLDAGLVLAVASSSPRSWVEGHLTRLGLRQFFKVVCTADDVSEVKPSPELFLLAASKLGVTSSEVIVFEDSPNGITAARRAGMFCVTIPNEITLTMDVSHANRRVTSFLELDPVQLVAEHSDG